MSETKEIVVLNGNDLSLDDIVAIGNGEKQVALDEESLEKCKACREFLLDQIKDGKVVYGVNSSYGSMCTRLLTMIPWNYFRKI